MNGRSDPQWPSVKLGPLVSFKTGKLNSNAAIPNGSYPFFTCSQEVFRTDSYSFDAEVVLLAGNNANGIYPIHYFRGKFDAYQRTYVIRSLDQTQLTNRFLFYTLRLKLEFLRNISTGAATKFLTLTILNDLDIGLPPITVQRKTAAILSAYDDLIENNTRRIRILEEMARSLYNEWFMKSRFPGYEKVRISDSRLGPMSQRFRIRNLFEVAEVTYGFPFRSKQFSEKPVGKPVIRIRDINRGLSNTFTTEEVHEKYRVKNGDFLVGMDGEFHMGKWVGGEALLNQRVVRFRPKIRISPYLLFLALRAPIDSFQSSIVGTTVAHLSDEDLRSIELLIPDEILLEEMNPIFDSLLSLELNLGLRNINLRRTRDLLLPRLISGELDVENLEIAVPEAAPNDETATFAPATV